MRARKFKLPALLIAGTLILTLGSGCGGKRVGSLVDPAEQPAPKETPAPATPTPEPTPPVVVNPNPSNPANPSNPGNTGAQLQAKGELVKNGWVSSIVIKVIVTNPSTVTLSGEVTVTFTDGGKPTTAVESLRVTVLPGETVTRYVENSKWTLDNATVTVKTDAPVTTNTYGY